MSFDSSKIPQELLGSWKQVSGRYIDHETGEERPGLSKAPNGYVHFSRNGRMFNFSVDSARKKPEGPLATGEEAEQLFRTLLGYTGYYSVEGDQVHFDVDVSWNESWTGTRQTRTWKVEGDRMYISCDIINPMTGKPATHRLTFDRDRGPPE